MTKKEELLKKSENHYEDSKQIRKELIEYLDKYIPEELKSHIDLDMINTCTYDVIDKLIKCLPEVSSIMDLKKYDIFENPHSGERLQFIASAVYQKDKNMVLVDAITEDNKFSQFLFPKDEEVVLSSDMECPCCLCKDEEDNNNENIDIINIRIV